MPHHWPQLAWSDWSDTGETLHMWTQVVGKIRMAKSHPINHWWHVPLYVTARGLGTSPIPDGPRMFEIDFDFVDHALRVNTTDGDVLEFELRPMTVAEFYGRVMSALEELHIDVSFTSTPSEVADPVPFEKDKQHAAYDPLAVTRFWQILFAAADVLTEFRSQFAGKASPVHFFWGGFDLAVSLFSGRNAPPHPGAPGLPIGMLREAYSHECASAGFWPGGPTSDATFFAYTYPEPPGYAEAPLALKEAFYSKDLHEFLLPYDAMRTSESPDAALMSFLRSTYEAGSSRGNWPDLRWNPASPSLLRRG